MNAPGPVRDLEKAISAAVAAGEQPDPQIVEQYQAATARKTPRGGKLRNFRAPDDLWERVLDEAERTETTPADVLRTLIADRLPIRADILDD